MYLILPRRQTLWLLRVDHDRVAGTLSAGLATALLAVCLYELEMPPEEALLRAGAVFVLTYGACLAWLILYQRIVVRALAREFRAVKAARRAAREAAMAALDSNTRGEDEAAAFPGGAA